jgi:hypothetical protein
MAVQMEESLDGAGHADRAGAKGCLIGIGPAIGEQKMLQSGRCGRLLPEVDGPRELLAFLVDQVAAAAEIAGLGMTDAQAKGQGEGGVKGVAAIRKGIDGQLGGKGMGRGDGATTLGGGDGPGLGAGDGDAKGVVAVLAQGGVPFSGAEGFGVSAERGPGAVRARRCRIGWNSGLALRCRAKARPCAWACQYCQGSRCRPSS